MDHALIDARRLEANTQLDPKNKGALGQFMTPSAIALFMASLFEDTPNAVLLDAGAGIGSLTHAASTTLHLARVDAWEIDPIMDWSKQHYDAEYAPNSRETFRLQTMHQFIEGGICLTTLISLNDL